MFKQQQKKYFINEIKQQKLPNLKKRKTVAEKNDQNLKNIQEYIIWSYIYMLYIIPYV